MTHWPADGFEVGEAADFVELASGRSATDLCFVLFRRG